MEMNAFSQEQKRIVFQKNAIQSVLSYQWNDKIRPLPGAELLGCVD